MTQFATYADLLNAITDESGRDILNPATGEVVGRAPENTVEDLNAAVDAARAAQKDFAKPVSYTHLTLPTNREV